MKNRHNVATPTAIHLQDWWAILVRVFNRVMSDNVGLLSAGIAPSRAHARWRWIIPDAVAAGVIWLVASIAFSAYLENFNAYNATFGSLGAVAALLMWFWISAYALCLGAELNAQLELFTTVDTTIDKAARRGHRGGYVADHVEAPEAEPAPAQDANLNSEQAGERTPLLKASDSTII